MSASNICIVIPAFNEAKRIGPVVEGARRHAVVVVVDDGSADGTAEVAAGAGAVVLRQPVNQGKGAALAAGFAYAREHGFDAVITMDADGQHAPSELPRFIAAFRAHRPAVVVGSRMDNLKDMPFVRRWTNIIMSWMLSRRMGQRVPDTQCGYRLYRQDVLPYLAVDAQRFAAESEVLLNLAARGFTIESVPVSTIYGDEKSKINPVVDTVRFFGMLRRHRVPRNTSSTSATP